MTAETEIQRLAAFPLGGEGGNPAGVVLDASGLAAAEMQAVASEVGFPETAFVTAADPAERVLEIRFFSPVAEVPFCGHATIATAVALAERFGAGDRVLITPGGEVSVTTKARGGEIVASFASPEPRVEPFPVPVLRRLLGLLGIGPADLSPAFPPRLAWAGNLHPVLTLAERACFDRFEFDPGRLRELMREQGWPATVTTLLAGEPGVFEARNLFPVGTVDEDPATGSAAAAVGGYLRALGLIKPPSQIVIRQGHHIGYPCRIEVTVPPVGGIVVTGSARRL